MLIYLLCVQCTCDMFYITDILASYLCSNVEHQKNEQNFDGIISTSHALIMPDNANGAIILYLCKYANT